MQSDGEPTDDFQQGLDELMALPWGKKAVRLSIAIGNDANLDVLQQFIGHNELQPLVAHNAAELVKFIKWASTQVLKAASSPESQKVGQAKPTTNVPLAMPPVNNNVSATDVF